MAPLQSRQIQVAEDHRAKDRQVLHTSFRTLNMIQRVSFLANASYTAGLILSRKCQSCLRLLLSSPFSHCTSAGLLGANFDVLRVAFETFECVVSLVNASTRNVVLTPLLLVFRREIAFCEMLKDLLKISALSDTEIYILPGCKDGINCSLLTVFRVSEPRVSENFRDLISGAKRREKMPPKPSAVREIITLFEVIG